MTDARHRIRSATALFIGVAASAMGYTMSVAVLPLVAEDLMGSPRWSGVPAALATTGLAVGTTWLAVLMVRAGRRRALAWGYWASMAAAAGAAAGAATGFFPLMVVSIFIFGAGYSSSRLSRYAAADLYDADRRSSAIGWNVWAATIGSVVGPLLLETTRRAGEAAGFSGIVGPFVLAAFTFGVAGLAVWLLYLTRRPCCTPGRA